MPPGDGRGPSQGRYEPLHSRAWLFVDVLDGIFGKAGLLGDGLRDGAVKERHAEPFGNPRPDDASARPEKGS
jgi:hypothetical protein